jgi:sulfite reductase (NADPH) flavoprotein alpha-component
MATVVDAYCISEGSNKETNHYVVSIRGSGLRYKPGDSLGFYPTNDSELVKKTIRKLRFSRNILIKTKDVKETTIEEALLHRFTIHRAGKKFLTAVVAKMRNGK